MELKIQLVCPACDRPQSLDISDFAPGRSRQCSACQTPARLTPDSLEKFSRDLRRYCQD